MSHMRRQVGAQKDKHRTPTKSSQPIPATPQIEPPILQHLTPTLVRSLQRTCGNRATCNLVKQRRHQQQDLMIQRALTSVASNVLSSAALDNEDYADHFHEVSANVSLKEQKPILAQVKPKRGLFLSNSIKTRYAKLRKYISAFNLKEWARILIGKRGDRLFTTQKREEYFERTLRYSKMQAGLMSKPLSSPETQSFLETKGFSGGIELTDKEKRAVEQEQLTSKKLPRVEIRSTYLAVKVPVNILGFETMQMVRGHLYVIYTTTDGRQYLFRGSQNNDTGNVQVETEQYSADGKDWDPSAPSKTVASGKAAHGKLVTLRSAANAINSMGVKYGGLEGNNCNSAAYTLLALAGLPKVTPNIFLTGWGKMLQPVSEDDEGDGEKKDPITKAPEADMRCVVLKSAPICHDSAGKRKAGDLKKWDVVTVRGEELDGTYNLYIEYGKGKRGFIVSDPAVLIQAPSDIVASAWASTNTNVLKVGTTAQGTGDSLKAGVKVERILNTQFPRISDDYWHVFYKKGTMAKLGMVPKSAFDKSKAPLEESKLLSPKPEGTDTTVSVQKTSVYPKQKAENEQDVLVKGTAVTVFDDQPSGKNDYLEKIWYANGKIGFVDSDDLAYVG